jgi:hypothetical protein
MEKYLVQEGDTWDSIALQFGITDGKTLMEFHNEHSYLLEDLQGDNIIAGAKILVLGNGKSVNDDDETVDPMNGYDDEAEDQTADEEKNSGNKEEQKKQEQKQSEGGTSEHNGKYFVVQKGMCQCNQGFKFPKFKVTSHEKHYWNDKDGEADFLAVTEDDLQLDPAAQPFGQCKLKPSSGGYLPCAYAPAGKWTKTYEKVKVMGKSSVTELSELMCTTGGKITILKHGQQSEVGQSNVKKADAKEQQIYNPILNFSEFQDSVNDDNEYE